MSSHAALHGIKIGCVQYLNAKPLIHGYDGRVVFDHPSRLAEALSNGQLDVALVPVYEMFGRGGYKAVDGVSISSFGSVFSVFLAYRGELRELREVSLDPASLTSSHLLRCILREYHGIQPAVVPDAKSGARLLIGNQAIAFRQRHRDDYHFLDLGEEWTKQTSLPFVFALWLIRPEVQNPEAVAEALRVLKRGGLTHLDQIALEEAGLDPHFCERYLRRHIRYDLGELEKRGIAKFHELLLKHGFAHPGGGGMGFV